MSIKLLIVGGVAGGATAAARARRLDESAEIILFERGGYVSFANCGLPYYIGGVIPDRRALLVTSAQALESRYNIEVRPHCEVTAIDRAAKQIQVTDHRRGLTYNESYDRLILSPGAEPVRPPLPGIDLPGILRLRTIPDADRIKELLEARQPRAAVVVGGGFIGLEMAENLALRGVKVTVLEMLDQVLAPLDFEMAALVQNHLEEKGVACRLGEGVKGFADRDGRIVVRTSRDLEIECDLVVLSIGIRPENTLAKAAGLELGERGGIRVDSTLRTSDPDIFAIGDVVEVRDLTFGWPTMTALAGPANKQGRLAADNALGRSSPFRGTLGTAVVKIFDLTAAATGASEKVLKAKGIPFLTCHTHSADHATYYPGATMMSIKLVFAPDGGRVLGAQIVGRQGVDKRLDVLATSLKAGLTVFDLEELELAYAPPYSSAKDPVNMVGFVAANILKGDLANISWSEVPGLDPERDVILDLREIKELEATGIIPGAVHLPLGRLRAQLAKLDRSKRYVLYCAVGMRAYIGYRILVQNGFRALNLSGGMTTYLGARGRVVEFIRPR